MTVASALTLTLSVTARMIVEMDLMRLIVVCDFFNQFKKKGRRKRRCLSSISYKNMQNANFQYDFIIVQK